MIRSSLKKKKKTFWRILWCLIVNINAMQSDFCNAFYQQGRRMQPFLVVKTNYRCCKLTLRLIFAPTRLNRRKQQVITWPREWPLDQKWSRTKPGSCRTSSAGRWSKKPRRSQSDLRKRMTFYISFTCVHGGAAVCLLKTYSPLLWSSSPREYRQFWSSQSPAETWSISVKNKIFTDSGRGRVWSLGRRLPL